MPQIIGIDIPACNGIVHIVNEVMLPFEIEVVEPECRTIGESSTT